MCYIPSYYHSCMCFSAYGLDPGFRLGSLGCRGLGESFRGKLEAEPRTALPGCFTEITCSGGTRSYRADFQTSLQAVRQVRKDIYLFSWLAYVWVMCAFRFGYFVMSFVGRRLALSFSDLWKWHWRCFQETHFQPNREVCIMCIKFYLRFTIRS